MQRHHPTPPVSGEVAPASYAERLRDRDPEALARLYESNVERVFGYTRRVLGDEQAAEDLTHDIFLQVYRALPGYDPSKKVRPWLFTIAANKIRDHFRSLPRREAARHVSLDDEDEQRPRLASHERSPGADLARRELERDVRRVMGKLPESMRAALELRIFEGLSFDAMARALGRNVSAVRKRYSRALKALRGDLARPLRIHVQDARG